MNLDDLIISWKKQDAHINVQLPSITLQHLFKEKSNSVLKNISKRLIQELSIMILVTVCFDALFFIVKMPITPFRWLCFVLFNLITILYSTFYIKGIRTCTLNYRDDLVSNLQRIIRGLIHFRDQYQLANIPVAFICILMFAGSQNLLKLLPWMLLEFIFWRWILSPKMKSRFQDYRSELEYTLKQVQEISE